MHVKYLVQFNVPIYYGGLKKAQKVLGNVGQGGLPLSGGQRVKKKEAGCGLWRPCRLTDDLYLIQVHYISQDLFSIVHILRVV